MSRVPRIRFKGFEEDWEQRKTSELFKITRGYVLAANITAADKSGDNPYPVYSSQTKDNGLMGYYKDYLYENAITWTTDGANAGTVNYRGEKFYCTNVCGVLLGDKVTPNQMLAEAINNVAKGHVSYVGNPKLMNNVMAEICIWLPSEDTERKAISTFVYSLDRLITLHQRKLEKLKIIKKSMLENLFPQNGEKTPKNRFSGFTKDWEQRKLSEIALRESNFRLSSPDLPCVEYEDVVSEAGILNNDIRSKKIVKTGIVFDDNHVLYGKLRPYLHNWLCPYFSGVAVGDWWVLKPCYVVREFIYRIIQTKRFDNATNQSYGSKMPRADWNLVSNTEFMIPPDSSEQEKIGLYFKEIDNLITLHQSKLEKLQKIKKSMLESMFV